MSSVNYQVRGQIAVITMNNPPVNGLSLALRTELMNTLKQAQTNQEVAAIVLTGSDRAFSGGADIRELGTEKSSTEPTLPMVIAALENSAKPVIAAIAGVALGGGLELALGAHFRVAQAQAKLGLPEVKLGLLPGAGGTQRLPRLLGLQSALDFIVGGDPVPAAKLADTALLDQVVEGDPIAAALALAQSVVAENLPLARVRDRKVPDSDPTTILAAARAKIAAGSPHFPAPAKCVEALAAAVELPFEEGLKREREFFYELSASPESRALRHIFAAERAAAKIPDIPADTPARSIELVGVIGAGTMGGGITMNYLNAGLPVVLVENTQEALDRGLATIRRNYENTLKKGRLTQAEMDARMGRLTATLSYDDLATADLIIEAVFENMDVKQQVFSKLDAIAKPGAILATNTSYLNVDEIAAFTGRPQDVVGLHFFSPANVMRLLEVVRGAKTADDVLVTAMQMAKRIKKIAVVSGVCDGFIGNRMLARYNGASFGLLHAGAQPQQIDTALQSFGMAMGPYRVGDLAGLDIGWANRKRRAAEHPELDLRVAADLICEAGRYGQKTGAGWYRYEAGKRDPIPDPAAEDIIARFRAEKGITPRPVDDTEIVERCIYSLINEGAKILEEGIAARASDIDLVYLNGYGFPRHRGGPMKYADEIGLDQVVATLRRYAAEPGADPDAWQPAALLVRLAEEGKTFN